MAKKKKIALHRSYFKNRSQDDPDTPAEVVAFFRKHGELPFAYNGDNWPYDMVCERQKRHGVQHDQFLTPDATAGRMVQLARQFSTERTALDACCGTGQITGYLLAAGYRVSAFDIDRDMLELHRLLYPEVNASQADFTDWRDNTRHPLIISNPPLGREIIPAFFSWLLDNTGKHGIAVLLLPKGLMEKTKPRSLREVLACFAVRHREPVTEKFVHTNCCFELVVLENLGGYRP